MLKLDYACYKVVFLGFMVLLGIMLSWINKKILFFFFTEIINMHIVKMHLVAILLKR